jgi:hypothetical protein
MASLLKTRLQRAIRTSKKVNRPKRRRRKKKPFRGKWVMWSEKDPRWDAEGTSEIGGDRRPEEVNAKIEELKQQFGNPPDDLNWTYQLE